MRAGGERGGVLHGFGYLGELSVRFVLARRTNGNDKGFYQFHTTHFAAKKLTRLPASAFRSLRTFAPFPG